MPYTNPVYPASCPDPFILKYCGEYFCYSTGWAPDGKVFDVLHSRDLIMWQSLGGAMDPLPGGAPEYWAPEVSYSNGVFYLYYSVGNGVQMKLRAAISKNPRGPFHDCGRLLTQDDFAIDAHVFEDEDGSRYLFYAIDFLEHTHIGTGTVVDRMADELTLEGNPHPVSLPRFDWQVFDPHRAEKGGVRWHTVEGPFVLKYKGRYYQMFSGGNWRNLTYGVSYAVADSIDSRQEWTQIEHTESVPLVLATIPGKVIGPGHNSVVRGPDNRQLYCVYHRWAPDESARLLSLDRLEWIGDRLSVLGPSTTPQESPNAPALPVFHPVSGIWRTEDDELIQKSAAGPARSETGLESRCFTAELDMACIRDSVIVPSSEYGLRLLAGKSEIFKTGLNPAMSSLSIRLEQNEISLVLPRNFNFFSYHLLRIELNGSLIDLHLDGRSRWRGHLKMGPDRMALYSSEAACSFKGCAITYGFEDDFSGQADDPGLLGWQIHSENAGEWRISGGEMLQISTDVLNSVLVKEHHFTQYELVINARLVQSAGSDSCYGFYPALAENGEGPLIRVMERGNSPHLVWNSQQRSGAWRLPGGLDRYRTQQFRFRKCSGKLKVYREAEALGTLQAPDGPCRVALYANRASAGFDLVRLTSFDRAGD